MRRRVLLQRVGIGVGAVTTTGVGAGCLDEGSTSSDPDTDSDDADTDESPNTDRSIASEAIETTDARCARGSEAASEATVEAMDDRVEITGSLEAPNPCHEAILAAVDLDDDGAELAVTVDVERMDGFCQTCLGRIDYESTIEFEGGVPETVTVTHAERDSEEVVEETDTDDGAAGNQTAADE